MSEYVLFSNDHLWYLAIFLFVLVIATIAFQIYHKVAPSATSLNLVERTNSWWVIFVFYFIGMGIHHVVSIFMFMFISFIAHRELVSNLNFSLSSRRVIFWSYLFIPVQYYLAYKAELVAFLVLIPVGGLLLISVRTILNDVPENSIRVFGQLHWSLLLTTFTISHLAYFISLPNISGTIRSYQEFIFFLIFVSQSNDIFQYVFGKIFGNKKLSKNISPGKTIVGAIGGVVGSMTLGYFLSPLMPLTVEQTVIAAIIISITGIFGDLNISTVKRDLSIKDMSNFIPGHGGVLDRIDSLTFSTVAFFYLIYFWIYK